jgi:hypothetical protein
MARFEMKGKEYELKLTFESVKYLNSIYEGGSLGLIGHALSGDLDTFVHVIHAGLFHAGEHFALKDVEKEIEALFAEEKFDLDYALKLINEVVAESFFYKKTVAKLLAKSPQAKATMDEILK